MTRHFGQEFVTGSHRDQSFDRYISFGFDNLQLCFCYALTDKAQANDRSLVINQKFVFNLNWNFDDLVNTGKLDLF